MLDPLRRDTHDNNETTKDSRVLTKAVCRSQLCQSRVALQMALALACNIVQRPIAAGHSNDAADVHHPADTSRRCAGFVLVSLFRLIVGVLARVCDLGADDLLGRLKTATATTIICSKFTVTAHTLVLLRTRSVRSRNSPLVAQTACGNDARDGTGSDICLGVSRRSSCIVNLGSTPHRDRVADEVRHLHTGTDRQWTLLRVRKKRQLECVELLACRATLAVVHRG